MLNVSSPLASAAERGAPRCRLRTTLLPRTSSQVVKPAQAGALTTPPLPESCRAASYPAGHLLSPVHRGEQGGQRACVRLAEEGGVQGCRGDSVQEGCRYLRVHKCPRPTAGRKQSGRWRLPWRPSSPRWRRLGSRARRPQESVGHLGVHLQRRDPRRHV